MRLTVRTLLAWIDGVLAPSDHQALGEKVAASEVAPRLVERVRDVVRREGVSAPAVDGRGIADDPNTAAEFLDNVLGGEPLQAFERVCLESDRHLAEVASCHAIVAEATRSPDAVDAVEESTRRALQAIVAAERPADEVADPPRPRGSRTRRDEDATARGGLPQTVPAVARPTPRGRRAPVAAWVSAAAAMALVLLLCGVLAWSLLRGRSRRIKPAEIAVAAAAPAAAATAADAPSPASADAADQADHMPSSPPPDDALDRGGDEERAPLVVAGEAAPDVTPEPPPSPSPTELPPSPPATAPMAGDVRVPDGDALAIVAPQPAAAAMPAAETPAAAMNPVAESPAAVAVGGGPVLRREGDAAGLRWVAAGVTLPFAAREELLVPPWCRSTITVDGIEIGLEPATRCSLARDGDGTPRLEVIFGRATVRGRRADARIGLTTAGLAGVLSGVLEAPATIDVPLETEPGEQPRRRVRLWVGATEKVWRQTAADGSAATAPLVGLAEEALLAPRTTLVWDARDPAAAAVEPPAAEPAWARPLVADRIERDAVAALAAALVTEPTAAADGILRTMAAHRRVENRMIAAATLALLGDYGDLVAVLGAEPPAALGERRWAELEAQAVPLALARGDNSAAAFAEALHSRGPVGKAETLLRLARGMSADDLASGGDAFLVECLADDSLVVRRYAIHRLEEIVPPDPRRRGAYRADREEPLRDEGIAWWRAQLDAGRIRR